MHVATNDPSTFVRVAASVMPKDLNLDRDNHFVIRAPRTFVSAGRTSSIKPKAGQAKSIHILVLRKLALT